MRLIKRLVRSSLIGLCLLGGCQKQAQTHVQVYTSIAPDEVVKLVELFEAEHPEIKLDVTQKPAGALTLQLLGESANPQADVVWGLALTSLLGVDSKGLLAPYAPTGIDQISAEFKDPRSVPHWVGIDGNMTAFAVNTAEIARASVPMPTSYGDLIKPIYKGMITMPNPTQSETGFMAVAGILQVMHEDAGWVYLDQLDQNIVAYKSSGAAPAELAGAGEHAIGISFDMCVLKQKAKGGPLEVVFPKDKSGWEMQANALIQKPTIDPAAKVFLDWAIGASAMKYYGEHFGIVANPAFSHPTEGFPAQPQQQMIKKNFAWAAENRERILSEWTRRYGSKAAGSSVPR